MTLRQADLKVVVLQNLDQGVPQAGNGHADGNGPDQLDGIDVRARVVQEPVDKCWGTNEKF